MATLPEIIGSERFSMLHIRNSELQSMKKHPEIWTDEKAKISFDAFFKEVCDWRDDFDTDDLFDFWAIGADYDGCKPGLNENFLGLYQELMDYATNPKTYQKEG